MTSVQAATMYTRDFTHETKRSPFTHSTAHGQTVYITQITLCNNNSNSKWAPVEPYACQLVHSRYVPNRLVPATSSQSENYYYFYYYYTVFNAPCVGRLNDEIAGEVSGPHKLG